MENNFTFNNIDHYDTLFENSVDPILFVKGFKYVDCNKAALKALNISSKDDLIDTHPAYISPQFQPDGKSSKQKANEMMQNSYDNGVIRFEWLHKKITNETFWVEITLKPMKIKDEEYLYISWRDIEKRKVFEANIEKKNHELTASNNYIKDINNHLQDHDKTSENLFDSLTLLGQYKNALDESAIVSKTNLDGEITYVNDNFCSISGYEEDELIGKMHSIIRHPEVPDEVFRDLWETVRKKEIFRAIICNRRKDGTSYYVNTTIIPILDKNSEITEFIGIRHDVSSLYEKDKIIYKQSIDELCNLYNRSKMITDLKSVVFPKLAIIDIDRFKDLNDSYGIDVGDRILEQFATELLKFKSTNLNMYRISGDIFAILARGDFSLKELTLTCERIVEHMAKVDFTVDDDIFNLSLTIGIATGKKTLITNTEMALSHAKEKNLEVCVFNDRIDIQEKLKENINFTKEIKYALKHDSILMYAQKIYNNNTNEYKYETLMRMKQKDGTIISPFKFLEHAKKAKLYPNMTRIMIEKACTYFQDKDKMFSINLTIQDITNKKTVDFLVNKLIETNTAKKAILEIVESEGIENFDEVSSFITKMKRIGCKIAIDDFGTGYSNFEYIIKLNIDILKIDGSLIRDIDTNENLHLTVSTIVSFAQKLGIEIVAEFVHSEQIHEMVKELGITHSQGFFLHKPEYLS
ncbi:bifunctional diguanylate cyclase/phosphodiesterase [Poseidonibacter lekithochrous]|uniref:sensor domain-containing protein n=1 Tax=Poseidonibacter lekithochrous TaxID=1904463 RepID=UPI0008FC7A86|nr:EAL domain-containing protein [Poseidonibacter lekithochrous]QKJ22554.1 PAS sensor-containing diguanylate cyclase/phosphodiesterase [Poseidonibacter lekithochrous]